MEVLSRGIPPSEFEYVGNCSHCKSVVKFKRSEAREAGDQRDGHYLETMQLCPVCREGKIHSNFVRYDLAKHGQRSMYDN